MFSVSMGEHSIAYTELLNTERLGREVSNDSSYIVTASITEGRTRCNEVTIHFK